jgi:hypothetical protein
MVLFGDTQIESHFFDFLAAQYPLHPIRYITSWSAAYPTASRCLSEPKASCTRMQLRTKKGKTNEIHH